MGHAKLDNVTRHLEGDWHVMPFTSSAALRGAVMAWGWGTLLACAVRLSTLITAVLCMQDQPGRLLDTEGLGSSVPVLLEAESIVQAVR